MAKYMYAHIAIFSFKDILSTITSSKLSCFKFLQDRGVLQKEMICPGPLRKGRRLLNCGHQMAVKSVKDRGDGLTWRCRKVHKITDGRKTFTTKEVKVSIRQNSWIEDSNLSLEAIVELLYWWSQGHDIATVEHELKISKKTLIEWFMYFRDVCTTKGKFCKVKNTPVFL